MRKPRDFDAALKTLNDKTRALKENKRRQLGELIVATGADVLDMETLAGALLVMAETSNSTEKEHWRKRGLAFFRDAAKPTARKSRGNPAGASAGGGTQTSPGSATRET
ncbi:MAG: conjugal transfer protein TraD [Proteobacteria bacterium]|nr:conjugal transfer protein TraD [Pseudomonadota bacterium]